MERVRVNILGGQNVGKSAIAAHAFAELTWLKLVVVLQTLCHAYESEPDVVMEVVPAPGPSTPHEAAETCRGCLNFLVLRRKDYVYYEEPPDVVAARDEKLEETLRSGHVRYKSLPGCRASVQYVVKKICERVEYDK